MYRIREQIPISCVSYFRSHLVAIGDLEVVREIQVSADERRGDETVAKGQVSIISTYESG